MDYVSALRNVLLSKENIDNLIRIVITNFRISQKAVPKCVNIIANNLNIYLNKLDRYPQSNDELNAAINFLNKKCIDDFAVYLGNKCPGKNILRNHTNATGSKEQIKPKHLILNQLSPRPKQSEEIIILSESEKNIILKKFGIVQQQQQPIETSLISNSNTESNQNANDFLSYLTNPLALQMFCQMINQMNQPKIESSPVSSSNNQPKTEHIDEILDIKQVQELLLSTQKLVPPNSTKSSQIPVRLDSHDKQIDFSTNQNSHKSDLILIPTQSTQSTHNETEKISESSESDELNKNELPKINLEKLTTGTLPLLQKRLNEITEEKTKLLADGENDKIKQLDIERNEIIAAVKRYKTELDSQSKAMTSRINAITMTTSKNDKNDDNIEILDLKFDPTNDYNDLRNIIINIKTLNKILDITLVDYYMPYNGNNVTRFNNKFNVYFNDGVKKIIIPPGKYEIDVLLQYIKSQANYLDFSIGDNNTITIKNTMNMKFDLMFEKDTIFPLLGFSGKLDSYRDRLFYSGSSPFDLASNEKVLFSLSGTAMEPMNLEFDKEITANTILKKNRNGFSMKQMTLNFVNGSGQNYDFILPFKMCFKITYAEAIA